MLLDGSRTGKSCYWCIHQIQPTKKKCTFFEKKLLFLIAITNKFLIFVASNDKKQSLTPEEPTGKQTGKKKKMENTKKYYALNLTEWNAESWIQFSEYDKCSNPKNHSYLLFASIEDAEEFVNKLEPDFDIHYEAMVYEKSFTDAEILETTGCESMEDFIEMLETEYSHSLRMKNYGEDEKALVAKKVITYGEEVCDIDCPNYEYKDIEGAIVVEWSWERYIGYCRDLHDVRRARYGETEELLVNEDRVFAHNFSMILTKEEADSYSEDELKEMVLEELGNDCWKWNKWHKSEDDFDI